MQLLQMGWHAECPTRPRSWRGCEITRLLYACIQVSEYAPSRGANDEEALWGAALSHS